MAEAIVSGIIQGVAEWLPVSSEGLFVLLKANVFKSGEGIDVIIRQSLFLHLGTFLAALLYLRKDVFSLGIALFRYNSASVEKKQTLRFLIVTTLISGAIGFFILRVFVDMGEKFATTGKVLTVIVGLLLLFTAFLQLKARRGGDRKPSDINAIDRILLGVMQGISVLPGISRSGFTVSALLLRKFDKTTALKLSFLMSLPAVLGANIVLGLEGISLNSYSFVAFLFAFIFGLLTIDLLLRFSEKINFGYFVLAFGILTIIAAFL